jgi:hypothetical protein
MRRTLPGLAILALSSLLACNSIIGIDGDYTLVDDDGNGGGGGGGGGGQTCFAAGECPTPATPCRVANCQDKVCGEELAPEGAGCNDGGKVCNADGECVGCLSDGDCKPSESCNGDNECGK